MTLEAASLSRLIAQTRELLPSDDTAVDRLLESNPDLARKKSLVLDLVYEDYRLRVDRGEAVVLNQYCNRFPDFRSSLLRRIAIGEFVDENQEQLGLGHETAFPNVGDDYCGLELLEELGQGAMARVYLAHDRELDRTVVVKIARHGMEEAQKLSQLQHPGIVPVYLTEEDYDQDLFGIVMPFLGRSTLQDFLDSAFRDHAKKPPLRIETVVAHLQRGSSGEELKRLRGEQPAPQGDYTEVVLKIGTRIADALEHTHSRGLLHLDLKPSNVLVTPQLVPMLLDFNLSTDSRTESTVLGGTLPYMAPEQIEQTLLRQAPDVAQLDGRTDLFSLGILLYELLTGCHPFPINWKQSSTAVAEDLLARQRTGATPIHHLNPRVDRATSQWIGRCLNVARSDRPRTATEFAAGLRRLQRGPARGLRFARTYPLRASVIVAACAAVLIGLASMLPSYLDPIEGRLARADAAQAAGRFAEEASELQELIKYTPGDHDLLIRLANAWTNAESYDEAYIIWTDLTHLPLQDDDRQRVDEQRQRVSAILSQQHLVEARRAFAACDFAKCEHFASKVIDQIDLRNHEARYKRAQARIELGKFREAKHDLAMITAGATNEQYAAKLVTLANCHIAEGDYRQAKEVLTRALRMQPSRTTQEVIQANQGVVLSLEQNYADAIPILEQFVELSASEGRVAFVLAHSRLQQSEQLGEEYDREVLLRLTDKAMKSGFSSAQSHRLHRKLGGQPIGQPLSDVRGSFYSLINEWP